jgi:hypothetical protein
MGIVVPLLSSLTVDHFMVVVFALAKSKVNANPLRFGFGVWIGNG